MAGSDTTDLTGVRHAAGLCDVRHPFRGSVGDWILADDGHRSGLTAANAGRVQHAHAGAKQRGELCDKLAGASELAGNRIADAYGNGWRRRFTLLDHVEVVIERSHLVDLG